ncbi:MAG: autoinducer-2 kinase [Anaerolineae bacterium]|jgi:autoinducer 2 (AI-2) kinase|nr:MAG: autoinducer-2 kinase [Anaerolineae bacterium]
MNYLLALDAGTGSGRAVVFDELGNQVASSAREWVHLNEKGVPGSMAFDFSNNWKLIVECIQDILTKVDAKDVVGISTTSMREGIVVYDQRGQELWACANVDARAVEEVKYLRQKRDDFEQEMYRRSGQTFALGAAPRLLWLKRHRPALYDQIAKISMLSDWIAFRLGAEIVVDPSNGGTSGLFNLNTRTWDVDIAEACELRGEILSTPVVEGGTVIGEVSKAVAEETGLKQGTKIVMGGGDAQLGAIGVGIIKPNQTAVLGGTFWQQMVNVDYPLVDSSCKIRLNFAAMPNMWQAETIVFFPGLAVRWFRDAITPDIKAKAIESGRDPYTYLEEMAREVPPGSYRILPIYSDAMDYMHWRHAAPSILNLSLDPERTSRAAIFRALQENAAIVTRTNLDRIEKLTGKSDQSVTFAGGASKGFLWPQILADVLQKEVQIPVVKEATALGAAINAGIGVGIYRNYEEAVQTVVKIERIYQPSRENKEVYQDLYERWLAAYPPQLELADKGITESMWRAPGE